MTAPPPLADFLAFAQTLADASGAVIRPWFRAPLAVADKSTGRADFDPVTEADRSAEAAMRACIASTYPTHGVLGEEHGHQLGTEPFTWVLDPIDGTRAFICGMPQWGTLIALNDGKKPILGILDQPVTQERWIGQNGHSEFVSSSSRKRITTRACSNLSSAILTTTHPSSYFSAVEQEAFQRLAGAVRMTRYGGDCYAYGLLAMGFVDLIVESSLKPWDVQALIPIVEGAGGLFTSWSGGDAQQGGRVIAAGDARVHAEALSVLRDIP